MTPALTWNEILDIELRNKNNPDVARLLNHVRERLTERAYPVCLECEGTELKCIACGEQYP